MDYFPSLGPGDAGLAVALAVGRALQQLGADRVAVAGLAGRPPEFVLDGIQCSRQSLNLRHTLLRSSFAKRSCWMILTYHNLHASRHASAILAALSLTQRINLLLLCVGRGRPLIMLRLASPP